MAPMASRKLPGNLVGVRVMPQDLARRVSANAFFYQRLLGELCLYLGILGYDIGILTIAKKEKNDDTP